MEYAEIERIIISAFEQNDLRFVNKNKKDDEAKSSVQRINETLYKKFGYHSLN